MREQCMCAVSVQCRSAAHVRLTLQPHVLCRCSAYDSCLLSRSATGFDSTPRSPTAFFVSGSSLPLKALTVWLASIFSAGSEAPVSSQHSRTSFASCVSRSAQNVATYAPGEALSSFTTVAPIADSMLPDGPLNVRLQPARPHGARSSESRGPE